MARKVALGSREVGIGDLEAILSKETVEFSKRVGSLFGPWVVSYSPHPCGRGVASADLEPAHARPARSRQPSHPSLDSTRCPPHLRNFGDTREFNIYISPNSFFGWLGLPKIPWGPVPFCEAYRGNCRFRGLSPTKTRHFWHPRMQMCRT